MDVTPIRTEAAPAPAGAYSQGLAAGPFVFTAGMGPLDPVTRAVIGETVAQQTDVVLDHLATVLGHRGLGLGDVVKMTVHLQHLRRDFAEFDAAYRRRMSEPFPVRTTVGSDLNGILVEIDAVALAR
jgi:reactive intermediate/imine deaminase